MEAMKKTIESYEAEEKKKLEVAKEAAEEVENRLSNIKEDIEKTKVTND